MVDPVVAWIARVALAGVFAAAAQHKLRDLRAFAAAVAAHRLVPDALALPVAVVLAASETAITATLLAPLAARFAGAAAGALLAIYSAAIAINLARGRAIDCGCSARPQPLSRGLLARNALLAAGAVLTALPTAPRVLVWVDALSIAAAALALSAIGLAAQALALSATAAARLRRPT